MDKLTPGWPDASRSSASPKPAARFGVSQLWVHGPILERDPRPDEEVEFLVEFLNNDAGPWGSKLDLLENDLSGLMHRKVRRLIAGRHSRQHALSLA